MFLPKSVWKYLTHHLLSDITRNTLPDEVASEIHQSKFVDAIREEIAVDRKLAEQLLAVVETYWSPCSASCKVLLSSLIHSVYVHNDVWRERVVAFALSQVPKETDREPPVGLVFAAFHAGGNRQEERLLPLIDWVVSHRERFDSVCRGYYGAGEDAVYVLLARLRDPKFDNAQPLYLFNLRDAMRDEQKFHAVLSDYKASSRPTVKASVAILSQ